MDPIQSPGPSWQKILISLAILVVIFVAYGVVHKNNNWQTYRNEEFGYSIEIPKDWQVGCSKDQYRKTCMFATPEEIADAEQHPERSTFAPASLTIGELLDESASPTFGQKQSEVIIGENVFIKYKDGDFGFMYGLAHDNANFYFYGKDPQILSTFKFIEPNYGVDASDWQIYRNEEYGFSFMYPKTVQLGQPNNQDVLSIESFEPGVDQVQDLQVAFNIFFEPQTNAYGESIEHWKRCMTYKNMQIGDNIFKYIEDDFGREYCLFSDLKLMKGLVVRVGDISKNQESVEQILSTFKFTKSEWENLIPEIRKGLNKTFPGGVVEQVHPIRIVQESDITGDGVLEAVIYIGDGGASTDRNTLMMMDNGKPIVAQFKQRDNQVAPYLFTTGGSVTHGNDFEIVSNENVMYFGGWSWFNEGPFTCEASAYKWNPVSKTFNYSSFLSATYANDYCYRADKPIQIK